MDLSDIISKSNPQSSFSRKFWGDNSRKGGGSHDLLDITYHSSPPTEAPQTAPQKPRFSLPPQRLHGVFHGYCLWVITRELVRPWARTLEIRLSLKTSFSSSLTAWLLLITGKVAWFWTVKVVCFIKWVKSQVVLLGTCKNYLGNREPMSSNLVKRGSWNCFWVVLYKLFSGFYVVCGNLPHGCFWIGVLFKLAIFGLLL